MFAQSLVEHGMLDSIAAGVQRLGDTTRSWIDRASPTTWAVIGVVVVLAIIAGGRRRTRL